MIELLFIRHGATAGNLEKRYIGVTDEPLCPEGIAQMEALKKELEREEYEPELVFASPMLRTRQSCGILCPGRRCMAMEDYCEAVEADCPGVKDRYAVVGDFRETDFGIFEGKTAGELCFDKEYQAWLDTMCTAPIPQGESVAEFKARCVRAFDGVVRRIPDGSRAAFVVHGGTIMAILEAFALPPRAFYDSHIGNGECISCSYNEGHLYL